MTVLKFPQKKTDEELWNDYVNLAKTAQMTMDIQDGLKARKAYQMFLESQNG